MLLTLIIFPPLSLRDEVGLLVSEEDDAEDEEEKGRLNEEPFEIVRAEDAGEVRTMLCVAVKCLPRIHFGALAALRAAKDADTIDKASRAIVLLNGHNDYAWNARKRLFFGSLDESTYRREISLDDLVLTKHPKTEETWAYRQWLIKQMYQGAELPTAVASEEFEACTRGVVSYPRNYYAWEHRLWVMKHTSDAELLKKELFWTEKWIVKNSSDHSALTYRQNVFKKLYPDDENEWKVECFFTVAMIMLCPGVEGLWAHLRFCMHHYYTHLRPQADVSAVTGEDRSQDLDFYDNLPAVTDKIRTRSGELPLPDASLMRAFCEAVVQDTYLWNYELNKHFCNRFIEWLKFLSK